MCWHKYPDELPRSHGNKGGISDPVLCINEDYSPFALMRYSHKKQMWTMRPGKTWLIGIPDKFWWIELPLESKGTNTKENLCDGLG